MLNASAHTLKILAALVWYTGVAVLLIKSSGLFLQAHQSGAGFLGVGLSILAGLGLGLVKAEYLFVRLCRKNLARIQALQKPMLWQFYRWRFFLFLACMLFFGVSMSRAAQGNYRLLIPLAVLELSIAVALLVSSRCFWKRPAE
jgi:hypothetical protein